MQSFPSLRSLKTHWRDNGSEGSAAEVLVSPRDPKRLTGLVCSVCCFVLILAIAPVLSASAEPFRPPCVEDDAGRGVCVPRVPERVVSLAPSLTQILFDLGDGHALVGRTTQCNAPPDALKVQDVGAYMNPDLERILSLNPDLVLSPQVGMRREVVDRLTELGIPVFVDNSNTLDEIVRLVERIGAILGRSRDSETLVQRIRQRREAVAAAVAQTTRPVLLFAIGIRPLVVAGGKSFIGALIREAGGVNVAEKAAIPYPKFSMEEVVRHDPDLIIVLNKECRGEECLDQWQRHQALKAVRNKRIYRVDADLMARPCPRSVEALEALAAILHPDAINSRISDTMVGQPSRLSIKQ